MLLIQTIVSIPSQHPINPFLQSSSMILALKGEIIVTVHTFPSYGHAVTLQDAVHTFPGDGVAALAISTVFT